MDTFSSNKILPASALCETQNEHKCALKEHLPFFNFRTATTKLTKNLLKKSFRDTRNGRPIIVAKRIEERERDQHLYTKLNLCKFLTVT